MNILSLSISYIRQRPLNTLLNTLLLAFGVGIIVFLLLLQSQLQEKFYGNIRGIKMVVGAKGSPLQLILCNVYHIDFPTGNISLNAANQIAENKLFVKSSIPLALGDSYKGFRIVGTNVDYPNFYKMEIQTGKLWENVMEVSIGAEVAQATGLKIGDTFFGAHGILEEEDVISEHDEKAYQVVGIFKKNNNVLDRLILTQVESVWAVHEDHDQESGEEHHDDNEDATHQDNEDATHQDNEDTTHQDNEDATHQDNEDATHQDNEDATHQDNEDEREITALLITGYRNPLAHIRLPMMVNGMGGMQSAVPALQINRLFQLIGVGEQALIAFGAIIVIIAALSIFIALYNALKERQYDMAIMRSLGASRLKLFISIISEGLILAFLGLLLGFLLGHSGLWILSQQEGTLGKIGLDGFIFLTSELWVILFVLGVAVFASLIPALQVYRLDISKILAR